MNTHQRLFRFSTLTVVDHRDVLLYEINKNGDKVLDEVKKIFLIL